MASPAEFEALVADWSARLAAKSPLLMRLGKDAMYRQQDLAAMNFRNQAKIAQLASLVVSG